MGASLAIAAFLAAGPAAADVKTGVDAWSAGDYDLAVAEWRDPAAQGDADAMFNLAQAYRLGRGVPTDAAKASELYLKAAQQGHIKAADNYALLMFQQGEQAKAMPLIEAASDRGDPRAQYIMGLAHFNADYANKDWVRAYALLSLSRAAGLPQATRALGQMDQYIPLEQRQQAQSLAVSLKSEADQRLAASLAAADLGTDTSSQAASSQAASNTAAPAETRTAWREVSPAPRPIEQYRLPEAQPVSEPTARAPHRNTAPAPITPAPAGPAPIRQTSPTTNLAGNWALQLGAFGQLANADKLWSKLSSKPALAGTRKSLIASGRVTRLLATGFASQSAAAKACSALKRQGQECLVKKL